MQRRELLDTLKQTIGHALTNTHTATIGKVIKVREKTIDIQPVINRVVNGESISLPVFTDVPPVFLGGNGSSISLPIAAGDYALMIFTERCFDRWWIGQDFQSPLELRMHDYSDGFAIVGLLPQDSALTIPDKITIVGDVEFTGNLDITGDVDINGSMTVTGGDVVADGISLKTHTHPYTWTGVPGAGNTGGPV